MGAESVIVNLMLIPHTGHSARLSLFPYIFEQS